MIPAWPIVLFFLMLHRISVQDHTAAIAGLTLGGESLQQADAQALAGHLHQAQGSYLGHLVTGTVPAQVFSQTTQNQIAVLLQDHVDEVHHDHSAQVPQAHLPDDLLGGFQVVLGDGFLEIAAGANEGAGVHIDDRHGLGLIEDQVTTGRQPHLAAQGLG